jgi:membrane peptidoglycan carboxypeptidase
VLFLLLCVSLPGCGLLGALVDVGPAAHLERSAIERIMAEETPVLASDGETRLGVFFDQEHRQYVHFDEIPKSCVDAVVAAEDANFWSHAGVDPEGLARALYLNLRAGGLVAGGSTITQQTAKNLYYRPDRSVRSKWKEAVNALRLERRYSKQEILEFYLNQIHVSSNGRGIGIAARYFFGKPVGALGVHECAFIAGFVKAPSKYNPWTGRDEAQREAAREAARHRTAYVLRRMKEMGSLGSEDYAKLAGKPIPFEKGTFRYDRSVIVDAVEDRLSRAPFPELFAEAGVENLAAAGLSIVTSIDAGAQDAAVYGLWHHLTELGGYLDGATVKSFLLPASSAPRAPPETPPEPGQFFAASVIGAEGDGRKTTLTIDLGGSTCDVDRDGLTRAASVVARSARKQHAVRASEADIKSLVAGLPPASVVWVSVREKEGKRLRCDLELRPRLQGAAVVLDHGEIRAMVGGNDNRNFNRVTDARRQFGSTWKPLLYAAALQLGWLPTDTLDNRRAIFPYQGSIYAPRRAHVAPDLVSLAWAGAESENLATVWLLYHLTDRLNPEQVRRLAELVGLAPRSGEDPASWSARIRDEHGIVSSEERFEEIAFEGAAEAVMADLAFSGHPEDATELRSLLYGRGLDRAAARTLKRASRSERIELERLLGRSFLRLEATGRTCSSELRVLQEALARGEVPAPAALRHLGWRDGSFLCFEKVGKNQTSSLGAETIRVWLEQGGTPDLASDNVRVEETLWLSSLEAVRSAVDFKLRALEGRNPWEPEIVFRHPDFRRLLGLRYLAGLARALGVETEIPSVLSMPLGAADISLLEVGLIYQGFLDGTTWRFKNRGFSGASSDEAVNLVRAIRTREGRSIYDARATSRPLVDRVSGRLTLDILRNVVRWGTGRRAREAVNLRTCVWPLLGKTGTTNAFKNAAFAGYAPVARGGAIRPEDALTVAVYVGFDDNKPMMRGTLAVDGAKGALPAWLGMVRDMARRGLLGEPEGACPTELPVDAGYARLSVSPKTGLPEPEAEGLPTVLVYGSPREPRRRFAPFLEEAEGVEGGPPLPSAASLAPLAPPAWVAPAGETPRQGAEAAPDDTGASGQEVERSLWDAIDRQDEAREREDPGGEEDPP